MLPSRGQTRPRPKSHQVQPQPFTSPIRPHVTLAAIAPTSSGPAHTSIAAPPQAPFDPAVMHPAFYGRHTATVGSSQVKGKAKM